MTNETQGSSPDSTSCVLVIFGAGGDLTRRMLIPAIYNLAKEKLLPESFQVVGVSIESLTDDQFKKAATESLEEHIGKSRIDRDLMSKVIEQFQYFQGDFVKAESLERLKVYLEKLHQANDAPQNCIFYLATPPGFFAEIAKGLADVGLTVEDHGWRRVVVEKPFGHDLQSAVDLNEAFGRILNENQIYRIDHYLGKETVQNILVFRFANGMFEPIWNRSYIDSVQITVAETLGVEHRAAYYEHAGALKDMISSHLLQLLSLVAMEPPTSFGADDVRDEKVKVLKAIKPLTQEDVLSQAVRGQYDQGEIDNGELVAYRSEPGVADRSNTETYAALKLELDNWRWAGVPFYIRTGKRLAARHSEIAIQFKCAPFELFREAHAGPLPSNFLVMHIQPDEGVSLSFTAKVPGSEIRFGNVEMDFKYVDYFGHVPSTGYETLLYDCMKGDRTLFRRADQVESSWRAIMPVLNAWASAPPTDFPNYASGGQGPKAANDLLARDGRRWREIEETHRSKSEAKRNL